VLFLPPSPCYLYSLSCCSRCRRRAPSWLYNLLVSSLQIRQVPSYAQNRTCQDRVVPSISFWLDVLSEIV